MLNFINDEKKITTIPDLHGDNLWRQFVPDITNGDYYVFLGDYTDSFNKTDDEIVKNLEDVIQYKRNNMYDVFLLVGNHDLYYMASEEDKYNYKCSGNRPYLWERLHKLFEDNKDLFLPYFAITTGRDDLYIWSHAGITSKFMNLVFYDDKHKMFSKWDKMWKERDERLFTVSKARGGMDDFSGPFWADKSETAFNMVNGIYQIVGHSRVKNIITSSGDNTSVTFTDCLDNCKKFYTLNIKY